MNHIDGDCDQLFENYFRLRSEVRLSLDPLFRVKFNLQYTEIATPLLTINTAIMDEHEISTTYLQHTSKRL